MMHFLLCALGVATSGWGAWVGAVHRWMSCQMHDWRGRLEGRARKTKLVFVSGSVPLPDLIGRVLTSKDAARRRVFLLSPFGARAVLPGA